MSFSVHLPQAIAYLFLGLFTIGFIVSFIKGSDVYVRLLRFSPSIGIHGLVARIVSLLLFILLTYLSYIVYESLHGTEQTQFLIMYVLGGFVSIALTFISS